jgi:hypothetical protein
MLVDLKLVILMLQVLGEHGGLLTLLLRPLLVSGLLLLILLLIYLVLPIMSISGVVHTWNSFHLLRYPTDGNRCTNQQNIFQAMMTRSEETRSARNHLLIIGLGLSSSNTHRAVKRRHFSISPIIIIAENLIAGASSFETAAWHF